MKRRRRWDCKSKDFVQLSHVNNHHKTTCLDNGIQRNALALELSVDVFHYLYVTISETSESRNNSI